MGKKSRPQFLTAHPVLLTVYPLHQWDCHLLHLTYTQSTEEPAIQISKQTYLGRRRWPYMLATPAPLQSTGSWGEAVHGTGKLHLHACSQVLCKDIIKDDTQLRYKCDLCCSEGRFSCSTAVLSHPKSLPTMGISQWPYLNWKLPQGAESSGSKGVRSELWRGHLVKPSLSPGPWGRNCHVPDPVCGYSVSKLDSWGPRT